MGLFADIMSRVRPVAPQPTVDEDGFVHAADAAPEDVVNPPRRGNSGPLPERPLFFGPPFGWRRVLGQGTALWPWTAGGGDDGSSSDSGGSDSFGGGDF